MKIGFKFGPDPDQSEPHLELGAMTLIVGPNGAGKSLLLREISEQDNTSRYGHASGPATRPRTKLLGCFHPTEPRPTEEGRWLDKITHGLARRVDDFARYYMSDPPEQDMKAARGANALAHDYERLYYERNEVAFGERYKPEARARAQAELKTLLARADRVTSRSLARELVDSARLSRSGVSGLSIRLSTLSSRIRALDPSKPVPPLEAMRHTLLRLLQEDNMRREVNQALETLAGFKIAIDASNLTLLRAVSYEADGEPPPASAPWSADSKRFLAQTRPLEERCDGDRSLAALVVESLLLDTDVLLLDEPEISLHPPLARQLGAFLTNLAEERGLSIIAATHSPDFVAGCLSTRHPVSICRLDYRDGRGSALALSTELVSEMSADPLLRSTGILGALFHKAALVCEGASDVALYGEISDRLSLHEQDYPRVMRDTLMINANGRTSVPKIIARLRAAGVHCACITDLDLLNVNNVLEALLRATDVHENLV